jgi:hypothetical protein
MFPSNVNLNFAFDYPLSEITLKFADFGGNSNIKVNGDFRNVGGIELLNGTTIGGVQITVNATNPSNNENNWVGFITLSGGINEFVLGGQELWIDDVCIEKCN